MLGSHPGWGGWGLHILLATLRAGARPGDESYGPAAARSLAIPLELGDNPGVSPATSPVAAGAEEAVARMLRRGRREPPALPGSPVMWLLTAQGRNDSWLTAR